MLRFELNGLVKMVLRLVKLFGVEVLRGREDNVKTRIQHRRCNLPNYPNCNDCWHALGYKKNLKKNRKQCLKVYLKRIELRKYFSD